MVLEARVRWTITCKKNYNCYAIKREEFLNIEFVPYLIGTPIPNGRDCNSENNTRPWQIRFARLYASEQMHTIVWYLSARFVVQVIGRVIFARVCLKELVNQLVVATDFAERCWIIDLRHKESTFYKTVKFTHAHQNEGTN